jgi:carboxymethylenebutenolidase
MRLETPEGPLPLKPPSRRKLLAASMFTVGYAAAVRPVNAQAITTDAQGLTIEELKTKSTVDGFDLPLYVARPAGKKNAPAIIVVNEIFGIHAYIKDTCRRLAKLGYVAVAPAYFSRVADPSTITEMKDIMPIVAKATQDQRLGDTASVVKWLQTNAAVNKDKIGIIGFCWGGNVVWMSSAKVPGIKAGVAFYGRLKVAPPQPGAPAPDEMPLDDAGKLNFPVLGLYGDKDQGIPPADVQAMRDALKAAGDKTKSELISYPDAEHGFHADYRPSYNAAAAKDGWARMQAWFKAHGVA